MVAAHEVIAGAPVPRERAPMLRALGREIDRALPHGRIPVDEALDGDRWVVRAHLPGLDQHSAVDMTVEDGVLRLDVARHATRSSTHHDWHEVLSVPTGTRAEDVTTSYADGILTLSMPATHSRPRALVPTVGAPRRIRIVTKSAERQEPAPGSIVVGVDGSPASMAALRWALPMVRQEGCPLEIVSVWSNPTAEALHQIPGHVNEQREAAARAAATAATLARRELGATAVVSTVTMKGEVADVLSERARAARFLVLGSPRELGAGVPGQCQHQVHCPVFIVVPPHAG